MSHACWRIVWNDIGVVGSGLIDVCSEWMVLICVGERMRGLLENAVVTSSIWLAPARVEQIAVNVWVM